MKKLLGMIILSLLFSSNSFGSGGSGELQISDRVISNFQTYIRPQSAN